MATYCIFPSSLTLLFLLLPPYYHPNHQRLIKPDKSEAKRVNDIFTVVKQENAPSSWWMEASCVIHERTQHVQISLSAFLWRRFTVCTCIIGASSAYGGEAVGQGRGVSLPTDGAFILGLSEPAQEVIVGRRSEAGTVTVLPPLPRISHHHPFPTLRTFWLGCARLWDIKEEIFGIIRPFFKRRNYKYSGVALAAPATAPVPAWSEVAIWRWRLIPLLLCAPLSGHHRWLWYV